MTMKSQIRALLWPTLATAAALFAILWLGTWQMQRKEWKDGLLANINSRAISAPITLAGTPEIDSWLKRDGAEYAKIKVRGTFDHDYERYLYAPDPRLGPGFHVFTPLQVSNERVIWINRGYVPQHAKARKDRPSGLPAGQVDVTGLVRNSKPRNSFSPDNDVKNNAWYWRDLKAMHQSAFDDKTVSPYPFFLDAVARPDTPGAKSPTQWPKGGSTILNLPNRHLEYALTWYGLAFALIAVYIAFALSRLRAATPRTTKDS